MSRHTTSIIVSFNIFTSNISNTELTIQNTTKYEVSKKSK